MPSLSLSPNLFPCPHVSLEKDGHCDTGGGRLGEAMRVQAQVPTGLYVYTQAPSLNPKLTLWGVRSVCEHLTALSVHTCVWEISLHRFRGGVLPL